MTPVVYATLKRVQFVMRFEMQELNYLHHGLDFLNNEIALFQFRRQFLFGPSNMIEVGDNISHHELLDLKSAQSSYLGSGLDIYVEDATLGTPSDIRVSVRTIPAL